MTVRRLPLMPPKASPFARRAASFAVIGALCTGLFAVLYTWSRSLLPPLEANAFALTVTMVVNFGANRWVTFRREARSLVREAWQYAGVYLLGLGCSSGVLAGALFVLHDPSDGAETLLAVGAGVVATAIRFVLLNAWVFRGREDRATDVPRVNVRAATRSLTLSTVAVPATEVSRATLGRFQGLASAPPSAWAAWGSFAAIVGLSAGLNAWNLAVNGYGNTYYAAATRSMSQSWSNFFFGAFDPGGFISVDKPPVFLWFDALSARVFGYSSWSLLLPSAVAGAATVALVWLIVRRYFGVLAACAAGLVLALTPISVAVDRLNLPEPFFILALVAAAGATLRSLESRRWWAWLVLAGALVGVAFNTKMLAAWIPGPALALAVVAGAIEGRRLRGRRCLAGLAILAGATFAVSASWMLVVDAWPAGDRPYVGGSSDNSVSNLVLDYNGLGRVDGDEGRNGGAARPAAPGGQPGAQGGFGPTARPNQGAARTGNAFAGRSAQARTAAGGNATGAGGIIAGQPGLLRMFDAANGGQIAWFLPFALFGAALCAYRWRRDRARLAAILLFAGWILLYAGVFSFAQGIYHSYYTSALAPALAILAGATLVAAIDLVRGNRRWGAALAALVAVTVWVQLTVSGRVNGFYGPLEPYALGVVALGAAALVAALALQRRLVMSVASSTVMAGLLILPASWSFYEAGHPALNSTLPQAGPRQGAAGSSFGSQNFDGGVASLAAWLRAQPEPAGARWDLAVSSAQNASTLIAQYDVPVMAIGGFLGTDPTISAAGFADLVAKGEVRYVLEGSGRGGPAGFGGSRLTGRGGTTLPRAAQAPPAITGGTATTGATAIMAAVARACAPVTSGIPAQYAGAIYDCAGKAAAIRAAG